MRNKKKEKHEREREMIRKIKGGVTKYKIEKDDVEERKVKKVELRENK